MQSSPPVHQTIVVVDIADFTNPARSDRHRGVMRHELEQILRTAFGKVGISWQACHIEDRGDGMMILVPPDTSKLLIFEQLPNLLYSGLLRHNGLYRPEVQIQLRMAVHSGDVGTDATGKIGTALNDTFRIVEADAMKTQLRTTSGVLALAVSETIYNDVIQPDPAMEPGRFQRIPVVVKRTNITAWMRIFGTEEELSRVLPLLRERSIDRLRELLDDLTLPQLGLLRARVLGPSEPQMSGRPSAWEVAQDLMDRNTVPGELPRVLMFVEFLAGEVHESLSAELRAWNDTQAEHLRQTETLGRLRAETLSPPPAGECLHLVVAIEPDMFDADHYRVEHWRQDHQAEWPPARGPERTAEFADLERVVDELVMDAEKAWSAIDCDITLEFVLPRGLLNLPVADWSRELASGDPTPLTMHYPIVVRSLERMQSPYWLRPWRTKWRVLAGPPPSGRVFIATSEDVEHPYRIAGALQDPQVVALVLSRAPEPEPGRHDPLREALRAGVPAVLWTRVDVPEDALFAVVAQLAGRGTLVDLPRRVHAARRDAMANPDQQMHPNVVKNLVILWDTPVRTLFLDQPPRLARLDGEATDDRERAS
ncbi:hypothetical protein SAMN05661093_10773 [Kibdelosporangium aridum]|uniref:Guanylate cyclase domain-containing protein n=1 Tax=Kibdelosporangium aridum TaxID=2030 RepID=A0A1W2FZW7_KIBAR|nr:hypothetical protein SAMN05661093_10773 [Kibdelosporangium aridum]